MKGVYPPKVQTAVEALLTTSAVCTPMLREAVEAYAAKLCGGDREARDIPADLVAYVTKVTLCAYKTTDQDFSNSKRLATLKTQSLRLLFAPASGPVSPVWSEACSC